jgi:hypothetical protein
MAGALESSSMVPQLNQLRDQLILAGFPASQIQTVVKADGQHSEWFWRREFQDAYNWLNGQNPSTIADNASFNSTRHTLPLKLRVIPNPCHDRCVVAWSLLQDRNYLEFGLARVTVRDVLGKEWLNGVLPHHIPYLEIQDLPEAFYCMIINEGKSTFSGTFIKTKRPIY